MTDTPRLADYPKRSTDKLRYGDTDRQGHVNNAIFATFFETGRTELLFENGQTLHAPDGAFVIARIAIDFVGEILWPGSVEIGTRVASLGRSSIRLEQVIFQGDRHVASAESVVVHVSTTNRKSQPLPAHAIAFLDAARG